MKKIQSGQGASDVSAGTTQEQRMGRPIDVQEQLTTGVQNDPWAQPSHQSMSLWPVDPALTRRVDDLERRIKALEDSRE